ncbi:UDP-2,3-diacylglucosamine diphosphatase [Algoriphagus sp. CAU 1675]|uniref:UDP-2,3-diacylglucosamine diphosphatase n=1 Tax=Algoriphagus sp. CAU 1675 TaxID=3032597 RepID=UPI0023DB2AC4|nr:UDP-2,3-diacylglucosamine diphosphatase [Algoriphagus sp. CAU 1675]MDF2157167.1 UDP-2,3-diacylglucosamine diphosphatase [Algoriphagus sp. CAU 1675]
MPANPQNFSLNGKKLFFASDFHLGAPSEEASKTREQKIVRWLDQIKDQAAAIFLVGDIFDFWFEYKEVIPKGFIPFISKIHQLREAGVPVLFFTGNHDLWMKDYFTKELGIPVYHNPIELIVEGKKILVGHGDGLGPGDKSYKLLKKVFTNPLAQWLFRWFHPDLGIKIAKTWSGNSRISNMKKNEDHFLGDDEWLWQYCKEVERSFHHDYYIFGHRHLPLRLEVGENATYINLGEWVSRYSFLEFDGNQAKLDYFEK